MGTDSSRWVNDPYVVNLIRRKARQLIGRYGFTRSDCEDNEQHLWTDLYHRAPNYDQSLSSRRTFARRVIEHAVARIIEHQKAAIRDYRQCAYSLNDPIEREDGEQTERGDLLDQDTYLESVGQPTTPLADQVVLQVSLDRLRATLPPELRTLYDCLKRGLSPTDICRQAGIPRGTLWRRIRRLQKLARAAGIEDR